MSNTRMLKVHCSSSPPFCIHLFYDDITFLCVFLGFVVRLQSTNSPLLSICCFLTRKEYSSEILHKTVFMVLL